MNHLVERIRLCSGDKDKIVLCVALHAFTKWLL